MSFDGLRLPQFPSASTIGQAPVTTPEIDILRELVFTLNGVGGNLIKFDQLTDVFRLAPNVCLHPGDADAVKRIAECGWLHDRIRQFITHVQHDRLSGPMLQSLASGLHENLNEYYRLIATIEGQLGRDHREAASPANLPARDDRSDMGGSHTDVNLLGSRDLSTETMHSNAQQLTLTRFSLWTQEPRFRLRFLASLCDVCRGKRGGALASEVYAYTLVGDPEIASMMRFMLKNLASTLLHLISLWIYDGQLDDPFQEFFVACNPSVKKERLWHEKYSLRRQMIPSFITDAQASKILLAGKSISFLQHACGEKQNIKSREVIRNSRLKRVESMFEQDFDSSFDRMVSTVYKQTSRYLLETLIDRYHFLNHLHATRQFLLLGQGDFITQLMDLLDHELSKPATQILQHRLSSVLESAIRTTNAQYEQPEILQRLDVRLLDMSTGDTGWDVFSLDYHVDGPLATIFTDDCRLMYLRAFNFLWRAKRMEFVLSNLWRHQLLAARLSHGLNADLQPVLHLSELLGAELRHCVLECAWDVLVKQIQVATDLDEVIEAHQGFLSSVITRCLLDAPSRQLIGQLRTIFDLILSFTQLHQELNALAYQELSARERYANEVDEATRRGKWGTDGVKDTQEKARRTQFVQLHVTAFQARIRILASSYREMVINIIRMLCAHPDQNLRFLAEHLNFNGHYYHHGSSVGTGPVGSAGDENSVSGGSSTSVRKSSGPMSSNSGPSENQRKIQHKFSATGSTKSG
ncbi:gamma-tubulin complex component 3 [Paragonimus westermani]|uniref:Gamma-tubulin complex component 3 n=1 Tax=Paragonimus westermani TaxID=34504 RepID=A0A5J4NIM4_9TREM|nr:gamma-tubulin complex component 3 [Paragonimus westermani]